MSERKTHILVVDDERDIRELLARYLRTRGFDVSVARETREAEKVLGQQRIDLIVLDLMMPGEDGLTFCRRIRGERGIPIVMLTALADVADRIVGLETGADDYVPKPFDPRELLARIQAVLRRSDPADRVAVKDGLLRFPAFVIDRARRVVTLGDGAPIDLTSAEYDLLLAFAERPQRVLTRNDLLEITRGRNAGPFDRSVDVLVSRLRRKIEKPLGLDGLIATVRAGGYQLTQSPESGP
jgi:two-component system OmpR family response regulator